MTDQIKKKAGKSNNKQKAAPRKVDKKSMAILFFRLGETDFCARKDELIDISGGNIIYHLPLTPAYFDGVVDLKGATTYVFDLAALVGITSGTSAHEGTLLIISKKNPPAAFRVDEISEEAEIRNEAIIPIPAYLKSEFIDACAIHEERLIPIINLNRIFKSIQSERIETVAKLSLSPPAEVAKKKLSKENRKFFRLGGDLFAALDLDPIQPLFKLGHIAVIPGTPDFILGIALFQGQALTIIDTSLRLNGEKSAGRKVIISKIGKDLFGFIVDAEKKRRKITKDRTLDLPQLTRKKWMTSAIFTGDEIIPILKLSHLLSPEEPINKEILAKSYSPNRLFEQGFFKQKANITELILMGRHHALPAKEVKEVVALKRYRDLPGLPSIVIGVSEHKGILLPVIDMEACFGIRSEMAKNWKMIHLENGDFSALVITEAALDEKELSPDLHRKVPLMMKHRFLYGCYPNNEAKMISLILNVFKMAVYFDEEMLREIFKNPASVVKEDKDVTANVSSSEESGAPLNTASGIDGKTASLDPRQDTVESLPTTTEEKGDPDTPDKEHGGLFDTEEAKASRADTQLKSLDETRVAAEPLSRPEQPGEASSTPDGQRSGLETIKDGEEKIKEPGSILSKETFHTDPLLPARPAGTVQHTIAPEARNVAPSSSVAKPRSPIWIFLSVFLLLCMALFFFFRPHSQSIRKEEALKPYIAIIKNATIEEKAPPAEKRKGNHVISKTTTTEHEALQGEDHIMKAEAVKTKNDPTPEKIKLSMSAMPAKITKPEDKDALQTIKPKKWKRNKNKYYPPLGEFDFYTVEDGDTLWDIAAAYSKNPYDYNLVAEDNKIIDPDLIYPGQRLRLQKKLKVDKAGLPEQTKVVP